MRDVFPKKDPGNELISKKRIQIWSNILGIHAQVLNVLFWPFSGSTDLAQSL